MNSFEGEFSLKPDARYEILEKIGSGSFAAVYRARDKDLGREVAIKEIFEQYREDPKYLDGYWQESQLLASLQHPNVITIFDILRDRGWLIMELMQSNLSDRLEGRQMDLRSLRTTLAHALRALKYLHARGVIHGDIKPGNLMIDSRKRIKIGDFGLARRVSDDEGSLVKGTTKYMAPEVVSDDFGEVTTQSDLYSLGFTAYELMCGSDNFEDLFPGLSAFGRDKQVAWMMWHAAPDRKLPEITRVLEGVPPDLAKVIQGLTEKDPEKRYKTADEALSDLNIDLKIVNKGQGDEEITDSESAEQPDKTRTYIAIGAFAASLLLTMFMLFSDSGGGTPKEPVSKFGIIRDVDVEKNLIVMEDIKTGIPEEFKMGAKPRIYLENEKQNILFKQLQPGDRIEIKVQESSSGDKVNDVTASRPETSKGFITLVEVAEQRVTVTIDEGKYRGDLKLKVPERAKLYLNGDDIPLRDLARDDRIEVTHFVPPGGRGTRELNRLEAKRLVSMRGFIDRYSANNRRLYLRYGKGNSAGRIDLKIAEEADITTRDGSSFTVNEFQKGDRVEIQYDTEIQTIRVTRTENKIEAVVKRIEPSTNTLFATSRQGEELEVQLLPDSELTLSLEPVSIDDLRQFDAIDVLGKKVESESKVLATTVDATRPVKNDRWAIIIGTEAFEEKSLTELPFSTESAKYVHQTLIRRYSFNPDRALLVLDENQKVMKSEIQRILGFASSDTQVVVYIVGHAYVTKDDKPVIAATDFDWDDQTKTGLSFEWLVSEMEKCDASKKLLLFDCTNAGTGKDLERQPSGKTLFEKLPTPMKTVTAIVSCDEGERGYNLSEKRRTVFADALGKAFGGAADKDQNLTITTDELFDNLVEEIPKADIPLGKSQTPVLIAPSGD